MEFCKAGFRVSGVDKNEDRLTQLRQGLSYISDVPSQDVREFVSSGQMRASTDLTILREVEGISICVPTPLRKTREPDVSYVIAAAEDISTVLQPEQVVVLESTVYPGATEGLVAPILEKSGLKAGKDFYLAFSPERIDPGRRDIQLRDIPKVMGGINAESTQRAMELYRRVFRALVPVASTKEAEMVKLLENTFRAVNIGLVHELAIMAHHMGINIWEVIDAAATKPFGFMPFYPGPGWGGDCIPVSPVYLAWRAKADGLNLGFVDHAVEINNRMPGFVVDRVADLLNERGKPLRGSKVLVLGVSYKRDVGDTRESPALSILTSLKHKQAVVTYHDPYVSSVQCDGGALSSQPIDGKVLSDQDCVVIATDHSCFDYDFIANHASLVFDTRNATHDLSARNGHIHVL
ncbi:MAG: nucleotide sugar dehydrogenase [Chloroflexi bacterium]|nr:nucleotide sugar dehydrogenase [Chloroflexota bacterium]